MIRRVQVLNYRVLRYIDQTLEPFQVLIGPNASGKSTFLDVFALLSEIMTYGSDFTQAIKSRSINFEDITWMGKENWFEVAIEADIPETLSRDRSLRYELRIGLNEDRQLQLLNETLWLIPSNHDGSLSGRIQPAIFPFVENIPNRITHIQSVPEDWIKVINKTVAGTDHFHSETTKWRNSFRIGPTRSALANVIDDPNYFPIANWFKDYLSKGIQRIMLNSEAMRRPSSALSPRTFQPDGSNLPQVIYQLEQHHKQKLEAWVEHVRTALPDIARIFTIERPEDRSRYLNIEYRTGLVAPSWAVSDGTLRLLALTILAYIPDLNGIYLIEEPENGIHPLAVETIIKSLQSLYNGQVLVATHSPVVLGMIEPDMLLCFDRTFDGMTDIIRGTDHPRLRNWRGEVSLDTLFASGVLGRA